MIVVNLFFVAILGIMDIQYSYALQLPVVNDNNLIDDFLRNFPEATVELKEQVGLDSIDNFLKYDFPAIGVVNLQKIVTSSEIEIAGKSFLGGSIEITVDQRNSTIGIRRSNSSNSITGRIKKRGNNESLSIDAISLMVRITDETEGYKVDNMRVQFVPADIDLLYNITASDRAMAGRIKNWLTIKLPAVIDQYEEYIGQLESAGILNLTDSLL